jgi:hypothetical protein
VHGRGGAGCRAVAVRHLIGLVLVYGAVVWCCGVGTAHAANHDSRQPCRPWRRR